MPQFVISPPVQPSIPTQDGAVFPVRRVYCIGRNYGAHAIEMGHDPDREPPFFFQKNPNNLDASGRFPYPPHSRDVHHEVGTGVNDRREVPGDGDLDFVHGAVLTPRPPRSVGPWIQPHRGEGMTVQ